MTTSASTTPTTQASTTPIVVGTITATIAPDALRLGEDAHLDLTSEVRNILEHVDSLLHISAPVAVDVAVKPADAIPEIGVGAFFHASGGVFIALSAHAPVPLRESLTVWLRQELADRLDVSKRILDGPGYGTTLGETLVTEGLADTFSVYAYPKTPPIPWDEALQPTQLHLLGAIARDNAAMTDTGGKVHSRWFFGAGNLPRWAGFTIGASWVRHFLTTHPQTNVIAATELTANKIIGP
jgi:hypothetical protein